MGGDTMTIERWMAMQRKRVRQTLITRGKIHRRKLKRLADADYGAETVVTLRGSHGGVSASETGKR